MKKTHAELMADVMVLAESAGESGQSQLEIALMLVIRVSTFPRAVKCLLVSSACLLVQAFDASKEEESNEV